MINKVILVGNVGADPVIKDLSGDVKCASFTVATSESYKDKNGEKQTLTEWHRISAWRGLAGVIEKYVTKGTQVYIEGKLKTTKYTDKDGVEKYSTEVVADTLKMLGGKSGGSDAGAHNEIPPVVEDNGSDELPF